MATFFPDDDDFNADWIKQRLDTGSFRNAAALRAELVATGMSAEDIERLPSYVFALREEAEIRKSWGVPNLVGGTLEDAILIAAEAHRGKEDKGGEPYVLHPLRVMLKLQGAEERIAAVLHDVVEDTGRELADLAWMGFSEAVVAALDALTHRDGESYEEYVERAAANRIARKVKLADLEDNMDVRRLKDFGREDGERFQKYHKAWRRLTEDGADDGIIGT